MPPNKEKRKSVTEKLSEVFIPRPLADPENDSEEETAPKFAEIDEDERVDFGGSKLSDIRMRNVKILSEVSSKYKGKLSSRRDLEVNGDDDSDQSDSEDENDLEEYRKTLKGCSLQKESDSSSATDEGPDEIDGCLYRPDRSTSIQDDEEDSEADEEDSEADEEDSEAEEEYEDENGTDKEEEMSEIEEGSEILKEQDQSEEIRKGLAVQSQLKIWEKLLEIRINSQKISTKANSLPLPEHYEKLRTESEEFSRLADETEKNVCDLLRKMLELQSALMLQFSETKELVQHSRKRQSSLKDDTELPAKRFGTQLQTDFESFRDYRNSVLLKWHDRTKILAPGSAKSSRAATDFDVVKKIETALLNKSDLVHKSRVVKGNYKLFHDKEGEDSKEQEEDGNQPNERPQKEASCAEVYDDTDFYHQQLREFIEYKTNASSSPAEISKQFSELQKLRQKMKKIVDTRASKGRKIRYVVHNKLVNFMAPYDNSTWTDESKDELYRSLFAT